MDKDTLFAVTAAMDGARLDGALRDALGGAPWTRVRDRIRSGKLTIDGHVELDPGRRLKEGQRVELTMSAPRPGGHGPGGGRLTSQSISFVDPHLVVVRKPAGVNAIPFERGERGSLQEMVRAWLHRGTQRSARAGGDLGVVHRIDKQTSGLMVFARSLAAKRGLDEQLRGHSVERRYLAIAHGRVRKATLDSRLVADRGDGIRGSTRDPKLGRKAVTHVEPDGVKLRGATLVSCRLETGRTHQIRIHLAEAGHPLVGETVYIRDFKAPLLSAPRMMLHAAVLGFEHPVTGKRMRFEEPMPEDMKRVLDALRQGGRR